MISHVLHDYHRNDELMAKFLLSLARYFQKFLEIDQHQTKKQIEDNFLKIYNL